MKMKNVKQTAMVILLVLVLMLLGATVAMAASDAGSDLPWEAPLKLVQKSITGPVATAMSVLAIVGCGLGIAFGEGGEGMKKLLWVVVGIAVALLATKFITTVVSGLTF